MLIIPPAARHRRNRKEKPATDEPTPPPPTPVTILSVVLTGETTAVVEFSGAVSVETEVTPDAGFTIGDGGSVVPITVSPLDATRVTLELSGDPADGWPWQLGA